MLAILAALWFAASYVFFAGVMSHLPQDVWAVVTIRDITSFFLKNSFVVLLLIAVFLILGILQFFMPVPTDERLKYLWHFPQFRKFSRCVAIALAITAFIVLLLSARGFYFGNMMPAEAYFPDTIPLLGSAIIGLFSGAYGLSKWAPRFKLIIQAAPWLVVVSMALFFWGDVVGSARAKTHNHHMMAAARWMLPRKLAASLS